jgi:hypothetical protein
VNVDVWIDSQTFLWTNYLVFVEWDAPCIDYVSAAYSVSGGTNFPIDRFSNPNAVGFGGFGFSLQGVTLIGSVALTYNGPGTCCTRPIIDYNNSYGTYCARGNGPAYFLFSTNSETCWRVEGGPQPEACCFPTGSCQDLLPPDCVAQGGSPQGPGTSCATVTCLPPPDPTGACCFPDGSCVVLTAADCGAAGGSYQGDNVACATDLCAANRIGACCMTGGACQEMTSTQCAQMQGTYKGDDTACGGAVPPNICSRACCFPDGSCADLTPEDCSAQGGASQGDGTSCATVACPPPPPERGACCLPSGQCIDNLTQDECFAQGGGTTFFPNTVCAPGLCLPTAVESKSWGEIKGLYR